MTFPKIRAVLAILTSLGGLIAALPVHAEALTNGMPVLANYRLANPDLKVTGIDADASESFLALQLDSQGRLFAGAREGLFVYEPKPGGLYQPRQLLYRFPKDSWVYGLAIRGHDLYVATHTAIYVLEGAVVKRAGIVPKRLLWGLPMLPYFEEHQGLHALAFGPEGDLYASFGDNLVGYGDFKRADHWGHWTFHHGTNQTPFTTVGGVIRLSPDGNVLTPVARGLRNCCGLAFDAGWNLFGNDNDHESLPEAYVPGRLAHITPHAYFSWPRGWLPEQQPWRADLLDTLNPHLGRYVPTGQVYYDDAFLPAKFQRNLLVAEWGKGVVPRYPLKATGATFKAAEEPFLTCANNVRPVGVAVGRGGRIFVSSLIMAGNEASPMGRSEIVMITRAEDAADAPFVGFDETTATKEKLFSKLASPSWESRSRAHLELMRRGGEIHVEAAKRLVQTADGNVEKTSLLWLAAAGGAETEIARLATNANAQIREHALRALNRFSASPGNCAMFEHALTDTDASVALAGLIGVFDRCPDFSRHTILPLAESADSYLRQTAVQLLAERASPSELQPLTEATSPATRLAGVLAAGFRLTVPRATQALPENFPLDVKGFGPKVQYAEGIETFTSNVRLGVFTAADAWTHRAGTPEENTLFALLKRRLEDGDDRVARQAAFFLRLLKDADVDGRAANLLGLTPSVTTNAPIANARSTGVMDLPEAFRKFNWEKETAAGDPKAGQELFTGRGCAVCHEIKAGDKGGGGPSLAGAGSRFNVDYLLEAVMTPNKTVAPMFRWTLVQLKGGDEFAGLVTGETGEEIDVLLPAGTHRAVKKSDIEKREIQDRSPMPEGLIQTPAELRDLLAFLRAQK